MNDANATSETAAERATSLKEAREQLVLIDDASIEFDTEAHLAFPAIESRAVCTSWDAVKDAATYRVRVFAADAEGAPTGDALSDIVVDGVLARVSGLDPETSYVVRVDARNEAGRVIKRIEGAVDTLPVASEDALEAPTGLAVQPSETKGEAVLSWNAVEGATRYHVYVNGVKSATVDTASVMLSGLVKDGVYSVKLVASSDSGATSLPASLVFTYEGAQEPAVDYAGKIRDLLDANKNLVESEYEAAAWKQFAEARDAAQKLLDDDSADESALKAAYEKLVDALENLADHPAKPEPGVDYAEMIRKVLEESKGLAEDEYEPEAWTRFAAARNAAQALLDAGSDDAEALKAAYDELLASIANLKEHPRPSRTRAEPEPEPEPSPDPDTGGNGGGNADGNGGSAGGNNAGGNAASGGGAGFSNGLAQTGDPASLAVVFTALGAAAIAAARRKR